jgi:Zn-dependent protease with chaperone function
MPPPLPSALKASPGSAAPKSARADQILAALDFDFPQTEERAGYAGAMWLLATGLTLIPLVYFGLLAFLAYLVLWHGYETLATLSEGPYFLFHAPMALLGGLLLVFLIKPVFFRKKSKDSALLALGEAEEPVLFAAVAKLCSAMGAPAPARIEIDCEANAAARLENGVASIFRGQLVPRIGLPLVAGLTFRELIGVLAHEFGHFNQRHGLSGSYLIRRLTFFFAQIVFQRDKLDEKLVRLRYSRKGVQHLMYLVLCGPIESARGVLWLMLVAGELLSRSVLRRMEYDADRSEAVVVGTRDFIATSRKIALLNLAAILSRADLSETWGARRLADDMPRLMVLNAKHLGRSRRNLLKKLEERTTRWFDTHPSHNDRVAAVEALGCQPILNLDAPATSLFANFDGLARRVTLDVYRRQLGEKFAEATLVPWRILGEERIANRLAFDRLKHYLRGHVVFTHPVFPGIDADQSVPDLASAKQDLHAARETMLESAGSVGSHARQIVKDAGTLAATQAQLALSEIFHASPQARKIGARARHSLRRLGPSQGKSIEKYQPFAMAAAFRLTLALRILQSNNAPTLPEGEKRLAYARRRAIQLVRACRVLENISPAMNRLGGLAISIRVLMAAHNTQRPQQALVHRVLFETRNVAEILQQALSELGRVPYPFPHDVRGMMIGGIVVPRLPRERDPMDAHACAIAALNAYSNVVTCALGELAEYGEEVEAALQLEALAEIEEPEAPAEDRARSGSAWRYWLGYGGRAAAGVAMFTLLMWLSISPPVIPAMPWDNGAAPGGYQPNAFRVPFTQAPTYRPGPPSPWPNHFGAPPPPPNFPSMPQFPRPPSPPAFPHFAPFSPQPNPPFSPGGWGNPGPGGGGHR